MFGPVILLLLLCGVALFVADGLRAREIAVAAARRACASEDLQFLDDSIVERGMRLARDEHGSLGLERSFVFEYSDNGNNRLPGWLTVRGSQVTQIFTALRAASDPE